ncbi:MAG: non-canonical purine NTP pyrophosphatase, partial [bacterium]
YAGVNASYSENVQKLLVELMDVPQRQRDARFRCVIAFAEQGRCRTFTGEIQGEITTQLRGSDGFGYDPVFLVREKGKTFAELSIAEKNRISHRGRALEAWVDYLRVQMKRP